MPLAVLAMAFTTFLVVANIIATKIVSLGGWEVSVSFIAYPLSRRTTISSARCRASCSRR